MHRGKTIDELYPPSEYPRAIPREDDISALDGRSFEMNHPYRDEKVKVAINFANGKYSQAPRYMTVSVGEREHHYVLVSDPKKETGDALESVLSYFSVIDLNTGKEVGYCQYHSSYWQAYSGKRGYSDPRNPFLAMTKVLMLNRMI